MSIAKAISLLGSLIYLLIFLGGLFFPGQIKEVVAQISQGHSKTVFAITLSVTFLLTIINFCYFYFLTQKSKTGEDVNSATFFSLQLIILPIMLLISVMVIFAF